MAPVVLVVRLRVVHPAAKSLLADLVERPVVLLAVLVVLLAVLVVLLRVLHLAALGVPEVPVVHPVVLVVLLRQTITGMPPTFATLLFMPAAR